MKAQPSEDHSAKIVLVIHGGAGNIERGSLSKEKEKAYRDTLEEALRTGYDVLHNGGTSLEAVVASIKVMEDSPLFNAGKGAVFNHEGKIELDASIMEGKDKRAGAVAGVATIKSPIEGALAVMQHSPHVLLIGGGAEIFAKGQGIEMVPNSYFYTKDRYRTLQKIKDSEAQQLDHDADQGSLKTTKNEHKFGTVGAVALDAYGNLAAGTSTGGMTNKKYGRVGDSPIIGAGTYADNETCAVSATGHGEFFIRNVVAYDITALMKYSGMTVQEASEKVVLEKLPAVQADGGVIALDKNGNIAMPFNTKGMFRGYIKRGIDPRTLIYKD